MVLTNFSWNNPTEGSISIHPLTLAFGEGKTTIAYSNDGIYWNSCNDVFLTRANYGCWNGKIWVAVGTGDNWVATSYDGITWVGQDNSILTEAYHVQWNGTVFLAAGKSDNNNNKFAYSTDGFSWTEVSTSIFNDYASWIGWTGKVWAAIGSGGNTTATSSTIYGNVWYSTNETNGCNYMVTDLSSIITDMNSVYSSSSGIVSNVFDNSWNMTTENITEWRSSTISYDFSGIPTDCSYSTIVSNNLLNISGEYIQISAESSVILKNYLMIFNISGDALYETPKSWYLLGAETSNPTYWNILDTYNFDLSEPPSYGPNNYYAVPLIIKNNYSSYQYYRIVFTKTFNTGSIYSSYHARVMEIDLFYSNINTNKINYYIKPIITPNGISYPIRMKNHNFLLYTDETNTLINSPIYGISYYNTDISCGTGLITGSAFDGTNNIIISNSNTKTIMSYTGDFGKTWNGTTITTEKIEMIMYSATFNSKFFVIGGNSTTTSGNVLLYGKTENGLNTWYPSLNGNQIFTNVWGVASNSGYGFTVSSNSIYLDLGDKLNIITPKTYPLNIKSMETELLFNLNTLIPTMF